MEKGSLYVPVLLYKKEVGCVLKGKASISLNTKSRKYLAETSTFIVLITDEETLKKTIERKNLEKTNGEKDRELNSYLRNLKRRSLKGATNLEKGSYYAWIKDAGRLGRFGLLITDEEKLQVLSDSLIRLDEVGFDIKAMSNITFETYSETNTTLKVNGSFSARNDIRINCNLIAEEVILRNDITIRGDITANERISVRNDIRILGEVKTKVFEGRNDIKIKGNVRANIIKVKNDVKFPSDIYAERFEGANDIYIGGNAKVKLLKCLNDCTIHGDLITLHYSIRQDLKVHGNIIQSTKPAPVRAKENESLLNKKI